MERQVDLSQDGIRLDRFVALCSQVSRRQARLWIAGGQVLVGRRCARILTRPLRAGARVQVLPAASAAAPAAPLSPAAGAAPMPRILHLDRHVVAIDKPAGLLSESSRHGSPSVETLLPQLLAQRGEATRLWLVHRLDAATSGVLVLARTPRAAAQLSQAFRTGDVHKQYLALCQGNLAAGQRIDAPLGRLAGTRQGVRTDGKAALTTVAVVAQGEQASLLRLRPHTGRTHQLRVHLQHIGHPLLGDALYGGRRYVAPQGARPAQSIPRCMLHARRLRLPHPHLATPLCVESAPPADFAAVARAVGFDPAQWEALTGH